MTIFAQAWSLAGGTTGAVLVLAVFAVEWYFRSKRARRRLAQESLRTEQEALAARDQAIKQQQLQLQQEAQRQELRNRFHDAIRARWESPQDAFSRWIAVLNPSHFRHDVEAFDWLRGHQSLPLPLGGKPACSRERLHPEDPNGNSDLAGDSRFTAHAWSEQVAWWQATVHQSLRKLLDKQPLSKSATPASTPTLPVTMQLRWRMEQFLRARLSVYDQAMVAWKALFRPCSYVANHDCQRWFHSLQALSFHEEDADIVDFFPDDYRLLFTLLSKAIGDVKSRIVAWNEVFVRGELRTWKNFFDTFEKHPLSQEQREAIVHDEDNNLVVAGAGSGKTTTIAGKVGYLLRSNLASAEQILLLTYTRKAAKELQDRVERLFRMPVKVWTFHALGLEIVAKATGRKPSLCKEAEDALPMRTLLQGLVEELVKTNQDFASNWVAFHAYHVAPYQSAWDFQNVGEYYAYIRNTEARSLRGERMRSLEEVQIANFLTLNGVQYEYEAPYKVDTTTSSRRQYKPDFYLPDHGIYIEHFGVDKAGNPPPWYSDKDRRKYVQGMEWKRTTHKSNNTRLIQTYSWQRRERKLLAGLEKSLMEVGVALQPVAIDDVLETLNRAAVVDPILQLLATFLSLFKSGGHVLNELLKHCPDSPNTDRFTLFLRIFAAVHERYSATLASRGEIDFADMIVQATKLVSNGDYESPFRYILIDEFQDISRARASLITRLRDQVDGAKIFCVGDDWQSIFRFAGSDISLMTRFRQTFGEVRQTVLAMTFRFPDNLARLSSSFVLKNSAQIRKTLRTHKKDDRPPILLYLTDGQEDLLLEVLRDIAAEVHGKQALVLVLNRYSYQKKGADFQERVRTDFPALQVKFETAHASKGLEADYVVVDNLRCGRKGFPSEIVDDPVLNLVLPQPDSYQHGEERRLFYVAVTRSRNRVYLIADATSPSCFVDEILTEYASERVIARSSAIIAEACPSCGTGRLIERDGINGVFFSCSHFPVCSYSENPCPECDKGRIVRNADLTTRCLLCAHPGRVCPSCRKGLLILRKGRNGPFFGCTLYAAELNTCGYSEDILAAPI